MDRWARQAALGIEVVPEVNWIFTISWFERASDSAGGLELLYELKSVKGVVACSGLGSIRPPELSTRTICCSFGAVSDCNFEADRSGTRLSRRLMFDRGALKGRFVSVPMTRCEASRCVSADMTCCALNAGLSGTFVIHLVATAQIKSVACWGIRTRIAPNLKRA